MDTDGNSRVSLLELLYGEAFTEDPDATSVYRHIQEGRITFPVGFVWSPLDHNVPPASTTPLAELIIAAGSPHIVIENQGGGHVFTNSDDVLAKAMVGWLSTGEFDTGEE